MAVMLKCDEYEANEICTNNKLLKWKKKYDSAKILYYFLNIQDCGTSDIGKFEK